MSKESIQFIEMIRQAAASQQATTTKTCRLYCPNCGKDTDQTYLGDQGIYERYQCPCGMIRSVAVR